MATVGEAYEAHTKRINSSGETISAELVYFVFDCLGEDSALLAVLGAAPSMVGIAPLDNVEILERDGDTTFKVSANYEHKSSSTSSTSESTESFECGGGTKHVNHAIKQEVVYPSGKEDDADCAVGWNGKFGSESQIAGVDVPTADMRQSYTKIMANSRISTAYKRKVAELVGKVNSAKFKGWDPGEIMFLGMSASGPSNDKVTVTYNFRIIPNENNCRVAGHDIGNKKGFEYIWARSASSIADNEVTQKVEKIYKSEVCESGDFAQLGI